MPTDEAAAVDVIRSRTGVPSPRVAIVLGSGLGPVADAVEAPTAIPYADLPGFPKPGVHGHQGRLLLGTLGGVPVAVMQGRAHYYESGRADGMAVAVRALANAGCRTLLLTNAAGSMRPEMPAGSLMLISDHINFSGLNPLIGQDDENRFVDLVDAYDPDLRLGMLKAAAALNLPLQEGVYAWFSGPSFETPAEIRAAGILGADAVGMSTVPEAILARHRGLKVVALSLIANLAAGMAAAPLTHQQTIDVVGGAADNVRRLLIAFLEGLDHDG